MNGPENEIGVVNEHVPSPCISVCSLIEPARVCIGCFRTLDEIAEWSVMDAAAKRRVLALLPARRVALGFAETEKETGGQLRGSTVIRFDSELPDAGR